MEIGFGNHRVGECVCVSADVYMCESALRDEPNGTQQNSTAEKANCVVAQTQMPYSSHANEHRRPYAAAGQTSNIRQQQPSL